MPLKPKVLVVDDERGMRDYLLKLLADDGYEVRAAENGPQSLQIIQEWIPDVVMLDVKMPGPDGIRVLASIKAALPHVVVIMMSAYATLENSIQAMKLGAYDYLRKPFEMDDVLLVVRKACERKRLEEENVLLRRQLHKSYTFADIKGQSAGMQRIFELVRKIATTRSTVLIMGETGTGKELIARAVHAASDRADKPFVPVDCAALSEGLLESELFGHIKGAFTGAGADKKGLFETADNGTVFLDEISRIAPQTQAKLLRVLQEGEIKRVGEATQRKVDVRLIAATNEDLALAVREGRFREDLFFRLNVVPLTVPALRERREDIPLLAEHFIDCYNQLERKQLEGISADALKLLMEYSWPGNVRELENIIHRSVILAQGRRLEADDLPPDMHEIPSAERRDTVERSHDFHTAKQQVVDAFERRFLLDALKRHKGNISKTAQEIGLDRRNFYRKLTELQIKPQDYQSNS